MSGNQFGGPTQRDIQALVKINRPRMAQVLARERLFNKLDESRTRSVTWIMGPAGSGKTTLAASYLGARELSCVWHQVDDGDEDIATFFYYLGLAGQQANLRKKKPLRPFCLEHARGITSFAREFFIDMCEQLPRSAVLVFDNYHEVTSGSKLQEVMRAGLENVSQGGHAIVISRHAPPPAFARLQANRAMAVIGWQDLQLTECEAEQIVALRSRDCKNPIDCTQWMARTEGWVAGVVLLLEWVRSEDIEPEALASFGSETIFDYFAIELLERVEPEIRAFLVRSAILPRMTVPMAAALTGNTRAERILSELYRRHSFITRHINACKIYKYHPLLREFLLTRLEETLSQDELVSLKRQAAALLEQESWIECAVELLRESQDWTQMSALIKRKARQLLSQGRGQMLSEWLTELPEEVRSQDPWIVYWLGHSLIGENPQQSLKFFEQAFFQFREMNDATGVFSAWCGAVESIHIDWGGSQRRWDNWIERLEALVEQRLEFPSLEMECKATQWMNLALDVRMPTHPRRAYWRDRLLSLLAESSDPTFEVTGLAQTILSDTHSDLTRASSLIERLCSRLDASEIHPSAKSLAYTALATYYCATGRIQDMREAAEAGIALAESTSSGAWDYMCHYLVGVSAFLADELDKGRKALRHLATRLETRACAGVFYYRQLATWESMLRGDCRQTLNHARACVQHADQCGFPALKSWAMAELAWALERCGERIAARELIGQALNMAREIGARWLEWGMLGLRAYCSFMDGDEVAGLGYLAAERSLARSQGYMAGTVTWMDNSSPVTRYLFTKSLELGIEPELTREQIRLMGTLPDEGTAHVESWPWTIKIYTLGRFEILRDDQPLSYSRKAPKIPLRLLKVLIALGGQSVSEVQLIEALWPHEEGDAGYRAFATTLHRLRLLVGNEAMMLKDGRLSLDPRRVWIDVWAVEQLLGQAGFQSQDGHQDASIKLLERALSLYHGPFLTGEPTAPWSGSPRNRMQTRLIAAASEVARHWEEATDWTRALACYQRGLEVDDLAEAFYQGAMRAHQRLGNRAQALNTYHRCKRHLSISLGIKPSPATEAAYQVVRSG